MLARGMLGQDTVFISLNLAEGACDMDTVGYLSTLGWGYMGPEDSGIFADTWLGVHRADRQWDIS